MTNAQSTQASEVQFTVKKQGVENVHFAMAQILILNDKIVDAQKVVNDLLPLATTELNKTQATKLIAVARQAQSINNAIVKLGDKSATFFDALNNTKNKQAQKAARQIAKAAINQSVTQLLAKFFRRYNNNDETVCEFNGLIDPKNGFSLDAGLIVVDSTASSVVVDITITMNDENDNALGTATIKQVSLFFDNGNFTKDSISNVLDIASQKVKMLGKPVDQA